MGKPLVRLEVCSPVHKADASYKHVTPYYELILMVNESMLATTEVSLVKQPQRAVLLEDIGVVVTGFGNQVDGAKGILKEMTYVFKSMPVLMGPCESLSKDVRAYLVKHFKVGTMKVETTKGAIEFPIIRY